MIHLEHARIRHTVVVASRRFYSVALGAKSVIDIRKLYRVLSPRLSDILCMIRTGSTAIHRTSATIDCATSTTTSTIMNRTIHISIGALVVWRGVCLDEAVAEGRGAVRILHLRTTLSMSINYITYIH